MESPHTPENWNAAAAEYDEAITQFTTLDADDLLDRLGPSSSCSTIELAAGPGNVTVSIPVAVRLAEMDAAGFTDGAPRPRSSSRLDETQEAARETLEDRFGSGPVRLSAEAMMGYGRR